MFVRVGSGFGVGSVWKAPAQVARWEPTLAFLGVVCLAGETGVWRASVVAGGAPLWLLLWVMLTPAAMPAGTDWSLVWEGKGPVGSKYSSEPFLHRERWFQGEGAGGVDGGAAAVGAA